jgi:glycosyltransferase involved in cell wall biosynthesis
MLLNKRIAWLCPYPIYEFSNRFNFKDKILKHPVPWVTLQAPLLSKISRAELHIITIIKGYKKDYCFNDGGIYYHFLRVPNFPRGLLFFQMDRYRIHQCLREIQPDLIHAFGTEEGYSYAAVTSGYPTLIMIQGIISKIVKALGGLRAILRTPRHIVPILLEKYTIPHCQTFIAESRFTAGFVREFNPDAAIYLVDTPVRQEFFHLPRVPVPPNEPEILFVGSFAREKGLELLLQATAVIVDQFPQVKLHAVGPYLPHYMTSVLEPLMSRLGIKDQVRFYGFRSAPEIAALMSKVTLLALPSYMDFSPNIIGVAQVAGVPVVASSVGGVPEMIEDGVSGILVESGSPESLAKGILRILTEPSAAAKMATTAQTKAVTERNPENQVQAIVDIYQKMLFADSI